MAPKPPQNALTSSALNLCDQGPNNHPPLSGSRRYRRPDAVASRSPVSGPHVPAGPRGPHSLPPSLQASRTHRAPDRVTWPRGGLGARRGAGRVAWRGSSIDPGARGLGLRALGAHGGLADLETTDSGGEGRCLCSPRPRRPRPAPARAPLPAGSFPSWCPQPAVSELSHPTTASGRSSVKPLHPGTPPRSPSSKDGASQQPPGTLGAVWFSRNGHSDVRVLSRDLHLGL